MTAAFAKLAAFALAAVGIAWVVSQALEVVSVVTSALAA